MSYSSVTMITPPVQENNLWVAAVTTSSVKLAIPTAWRNQWITVKARGANVYFAMGDTNIVVDETARTTVASNAFTTFHGGECITLIDGVEKDFDMKLVASNVTHIAIKGASACALEITRSSGGTADV